MRQTASQINRDPINQGRTHRGLKTLLSSTMSGKGLVVQVLSCQFALPAIANEVAPPAAPDQPPLDFGQTLSNTANPASPAMLPEALPDTAPTASFSTVLPPVSSPANPILPLAASAAPVTDSSAPLGADTDFDAEPLSGAFQETGADFTAMAVARSAPAQQPDFQTPALSATAEPADSPADSPDSWLALTEVPDTAQQAWRPDLFSTSAHDLQASLTLPTRPRESGISPAIAPVLLAGPQQLNPGLTVSPPVPGQAQDLQRPEPAPMPNTAAPPSPIESLSEAQGEPPRPWISWEAIAVNFESHSDQLEQNSWQISSSVQGTLSNGDRLQFTTGYAQFSQPGIARVDHAPVTFLWQGDRGRLGLEIGAGLDFYDRLPTDTHFNGKVSAQVSDSATVAIALDQGPQFANAQTLDNQISRWRYGPELYWQITPKSSLFSQLQFGNYSDGNAEQQSLTRLERQIGESATAAVTLSNIRFQQDAARTRGYFSPPDFLSVMAELSWQEPLGESLSCSIAGSLGQQRLNSQWAVAYRTQASCRVDLSPTIQANLGYQFSNLSDQRSAFELSTYSAQSIVGGIRIRL